jgi:hypothetical protein
VGESEQVQLTSIRNGGTAQVELLVDGTRWAARSVPCPERTGVQLTGLVWVSGRRDVVVDWQADPTVGVVDRMHNTDGGRHRGRVDVPASVTRATPAIPDGGVLVVAGARALPGSATCEVPALGVVLPGAGETALLATPPP